MKKLLLILTSILMGSNILFAQDKPAYKLYNKKGREVKFRKMVKDLADSDMIFFGEYHTNPISHWLQIELTEALYEVKGEKLFLGAEMFENGNQLVLDEYLAGFYPENKMLVEITQLWQNYQTDYKPLVEFAKENKLRFIASNIPRRYASMIYKEGMGAFDKLSHEAKAMIGPVQEFYDASVYEDMKDKMGGHIPSTMDNIQMAQASKDATMAMFSVNNFNEGDIYLHFEGAYHSNNYRGIVWWVNKIKPGLSIKTITTLTMSEWEEKTKEERKSIANYIIVVADNMTKTSR
ncbi:ChaN family lipoprotein [Flavicella sp.]|uniref:ChaN family lipoprotein n=1 Tax=Flavicella sp. TaxID=2957742 RepID=UPI003017B851